MSWGVLGLSSGLVGTIYNQFNSVVMENPYFEELVDFAHVHVDMWWICPMWLKCPGPHLLSPILPWFRPERGNHRFGSSGAGTHRGPQNKFQKGFEAQPAIEMAGWMPKGPWGPRGRWAEPGLWRFPLRCMEPHRYAGRGPRGHTLKSGNSDPARF